MKQFHLNGFLRRSCSAVLALALCMPPAVLADEGKARIQTSQTILDGLTYTNTVSEHTAGRTESFLLELEEDDSVFYREEYELLRKKRRRKLRRLTVLAVVELLAILGMLGWWLSWIR